MTFYDVQLKKLDICGTYEHRAPILTNHISLI